MWFPLVRPLLGTWPETQACALTGNQTGDLLVLRPVLNPLSHTSQGHRSVYTFFPQPFLLTPFDPPLLPQPRFCSSSKAQLRSHSLGGAPVPQADTPLGPPGGTNS